MKSRLHYAASLAAALGLLAFPSIGSAGDIVTGTTTGAFSDAGPSGSYGFNSVGNHTLGGSIDASGTTFVWGKPNSTSDHSNYMTWAAVAGSINTTTEAPFQLGTLTYYNGTTQLNTTPDNVKLNITLNLTAPDGVNEAFPFTLDLITTPNTGTPEQNADYVKFPSSFSPIRFGGDDGQKYTLQLLNFTTPSEGGYVPGDAINEFHVLENGTASAQLWGMVTTNAVPEPASVVSMAVAGLAGLGFAARRRRQATHA